MNQINTISTGPKTFSIIIPTFNSSATILNCIESVYRQKCQDFEVIVLDNQSDDRTIEIIQENFDKKPELLVISEKDGGVYEAMNKGISLSRGQWIFFLGSDDSLFDDEVLGNVKSIAEKSTNDVLYGNVLIQGNTSWAADNQIYNGEYSIEKLLKGNICHQSIFYRREVFTKVGPYNTQYTVCADYDMNLRCFAQLNPQFIDLIICKFNCGGISTQRVDQNFIQDTPDNVLRYFGVRVIQKPFKDFCNSKDFLYLGRKKRGKGEYLKAVMYFLIHIIHSDHRLAEVNNYFVRKINKSKSIKK
jgi:glycosyltransferase involved in cell wall biosynthesis